MNVVSIINIHKKKKKKKKRKEKDDGLIENI